MNAQTARRIQTMGGGRVTAFDDEKGWRLGQLVLGGPPVINGSPRGPA